MHVLTSWGRGLGSTCDYLTLPMVLLFVPGSLYHYLFQTPVLGSVPSYDHSLIYSVVPSHVFVHGLVPSKITTYDMVLS